MKITGGRLKGKTIETRKERSLRPTTGMVRESMFNILKHGRFLGHEDYISLHDDIVENAVVLDIFCGTGALGIEALSRGAKFGIFIDQSPETIKLAKKNIQKLGLEDCTKVIQANSSNLPPATHQADLIFIDPPYNLNLAKPALLSLSQQGWTKHGTLIILEQGKRDDISAIEGFNIIDDRLYDKTRLLIMQFVDS